MNRIGRVWSSETEDATRRPKQGGMLHGEVNNDPTGQQVWFFEQTYVEQKKEEEEWMVMWTRECDGPSKTRLGWTRKEARKETQKKSFF